MRHKTDALPDPRHMDVDELERFLRTRPTVPVGFAGDCLGVSKPSAFRAAAAGQSKAGQIKVLRIGSRRVVVPTYWLRRQLFGDDDDA